MVKQKKLWKPNRENMYVINVKNCDPLCDDGATSKGNRIRWMANMGFYS